MHVRVTSTLRCPIDAAALRALAASPEGTETPVDKHGNAYGGTNAQIIDRFLQCCGITQDAGVVTLRYHHSALGAALVDAGLVNASREYVMGADKSKDPFTVLSKRLRQIALGRFGYDLDLSAAHPHAKLSMVESARATAAHFLDHREEILASVGERLFPALTRTQRRDRAKMLFAAIDMDGSFRGFVREQHLPDGTTPSMLSMRLSDGSHFNMPHYTLGF
jgi:hypothetical protein